ncbi:MAG: beta-ketoacyl-ACP synthase II [Dehalococcoidia bacterium]
MTDNKRRVVVTGMGMLSPLGVGVNENWEAIIQGKSGIGPMTHFNASQLKCRVAGELKDFKPLDFMDSKFVRRFDPFILYAMAAARMAVEDAGLKSGLGDPDRAGVIIGTAVGAHNYYKPVYKVIEQGQLNKVPPFLILNAAGNLVAGVIAIEFGARGPHHCVMDACAAGTNAIGLAFRAVRSGEADIMIAGGSEAPVIESMMATLDALGAMSSKRNDEPHKASRPFDGDRDGFVSGEGSGVIILEELGHALERGAHIYGEVAGYGNNCDGYHYTAPSPNGEVQATCMRIALKDAGLSPDDIDFINAHGTSTVLNDAGETMAIKAVFAEHARKLAVSSNKSAIGHMWGAAGAVEAIFTLLTIKHGILTPTLNQEFPDPGCDLDYVPNESRKADVKAALSNSFGFGGINGTLALRKY